MTSEDHRLDTLLLVGKDQLPLYGLAKTKYANLSGVGAAAYPGRWNYLNQEAIYTSTEMGVPVLERLVHTSKALIPSNLSMMSLTVRGRWRFSKVIDQAVLIDPETQGTILVFDTLGAALSSFNHNIFLSLGCFAIALPSVVVPVWNVVLYPKGRAFWQHVSLEALTPFDFDPRLFPETSSVESEAVP